VPKRDLRKKTASHLLNPGGRWWIESDQFSAPFAVVKRYHVAGNTFANSISKFGTMMTPKHKSAVLSAQIVDHIETMLKSRVAYDRDNLKKIEIVSNSCISRNGSPDQPLVASAT